MPTGADIKNIKGLDDCQVREARAKFGANELPQAKRRTLLATVVDVAKEPMFMLLVVCGAIYLALGDHKEALMLMAFVLVVMGITIYQEQKTEKALDALRDLSSPRALVIRSGEQMRIAGRDVVRGDMVVLCEGDRVPADGEIVWASNLMADESLLTGESFPVSKTGSVHGRIGKNGEWTASSDEMGLPGGDGTSYAFSGTLAVRGQGIMHVLRVGQDTELGRIGKALGGLKDEDTALKRETGLLVRRLAVVGLVLFATVVVAYGITRKDWVHGLLAGITLAMAMLPEEFPVVLTIFMAIGAWRLSKKNVLTRKMPAVETLGAATVLCVDKTGTLTQNRMSVERLYAEGQFFSPRAQGSCVRGGDAAREEGCDCGIPEKFHEIVEYGLLASEKDPFDPMEKALNEFCRSCLVLTEHLHDDWKLVEEYALSGELLALSNVWVSPDAGDHAYMVAAKGAPEAIVDLCHMEAADAARVTDAVSGMADNGLRVLGVARAIAKGRAKLPENQHDFEFSFVGLIGLADPVRPSVPDAVRECAGAGIRVVMITGDYPGTAINIARRIGLSPSDKVITGPELSQMGDDELKDKVRSCSIYARMVPEQKLRLVKALKENGEVVAMTGDGVNDAPALKAADIGVAMGARGTDVAREASSIVLLDDDFSSIVSAVRQGRRIFDNLRKAMAYIFAVHVPIAGLSLVPVLFGLPLVLKPVHIAFLELIIDPSCSVVFEMEPEEADIMNRPPRDPSKPLFGAELIKKGVLQGLTVLLCTLAASFAAAYLLGRSAGEVRAVAFASLVLSNLGLIATNRSWSGKAGSSGKWANPAFKWVMVGSLVFLAFTLWTPSLNSLFSFQKIGFTDISLSVMAASVGTLWFELTKWGKNKAR